MIWSKQYQKSTNATTNGALMREMRVVDFVTQIYRRGQVDRQQTHAEGIIKDLSSSKMNADRKLPGSDRWL
jgi:hypothetical protein